MTKTTKTAAPKGTLSCDEIAGRIAGLDPSGLDELCLHVLDDWAGKAQTKWASAANSGAPPDVISKLRASMEYAAKALRTYKKIQSELWNIPLEIMEGQLHPFLQFDRDAFEKGKGIFFYVDGLYDWAKSKGVIVPEWNLNSEHKESLLQQNSPLSERHISGEHFFWHDGRISSDNKSAEPLTDRYELVSLYLVAWAFALLIDDLSDKKYIDANKCISGANHNLRLDEETTSEQIAIALNAHKAGIPEATQTNQVNIDSPALALAITAQAFSLLAENARQNEWLVFKNKRGHPLKQSLIKKDRSYISTELVRQVIKLAPTKKLPYGQEEGTLQKRLNTVRREYKPHLKSSIDTAQLANFLAKAVAKYSDD